MSLDNLRQTIAHGTAASKLAVLRDNKAHLDQAIQSLNTANEIEDRWTRLRTKADIIKDLQLPQATKASRVALDVLAFIRVQERYTSHRSVKQLKEWDERLDQELGFLEKRVEHAVVYANMVEEWLDKDGIELSDAESHVSDVQHTSPLIQNLPPLPSQPFNPDDYLVSQNVPHALLEAIQSLAKRATTFGQGQLKATLHPYKIRSAMLTLSRDARSYPPDIRKQLVEESTKQMVLDELAGALTQSWTAIASWQWPASGVKQVLQTHLNGKERAFLDIDIITAIFLQVVGDTWSEFFADELKTLRDHESWPFRAELEAAMSKDAETAVRRQLELMSSIDENGQMPRGAHRETGYLEARRLALKADSGRIISQQSGGYDGTSHSYDEDPSSSSSGPSSAWSSLLAAISPAKAYSDVFRLITTDIALARLVAPANDLAVLHGDLQDFGRSVPHDVLLSVLAFFGMPPAWLEWFTTFLRVPIAQPDGTTEVTSRGTPFGLSPSMLANELLLVLLDLGMACTSGITAHRNHDDYWLWNLDKSAVVRAWEVMQDFAAQTGLGWNETKTSCTVVRGESAVGMTEEQGLPTRLLRIGVLGLVETGKWQVVSELVEEQAQAALAAIRNDKPQSFLGKIGIINKHQAYLIRNCGAATYVNGLEYLETLQSIIEQFEQIITGGRNICDWAEDPLALAFPQYNAGEMNEALTVWPLKLGGAGLHSLRILALAYEQELDLDNPQREPFGDKIIPSRTAYEKLEAAWKSPALEDSFQISRHSDSGLGRWIRSQDVLPPLVSYQTYAKWCMLHESANQASIEASSRHVSLTPDQVAIKGLQLYGNSLERRFGPGTQGQVVAAELVPNYAIQDIEAKVKQLFA
ncbi:hypothetical protein QFC22_004740 [Naganishia vaughanmartiniae]|uniref:Uncharacterized protein n=1 Tax=Naganishia vaughanmartiniae TaxID=1424756 RepID=A0ACC2WY99_9TREE|nr:hypothetical protein QFC22_004740 [Naganishia vaughanmartiniae]